ncbi:DUF5958 family protein [Streptomyces sp. NPDC088261]|uniref:DUF5958 family protein n=1 Tax=Streptomyces sp. NPDC088261 TaxID=3365851 RepID=UPI00380A9D9E
MLDTHDAQASKRIHDALQLRLSESRKGHVSDDLTGRPGATADFSARINDERLKSFRLLIAVLAVAGERRRERFCSDGCGHAWHRLSVDIPEASA